MDAGSEMRENLVTLAAACTTVTVTNFCLPSEALALLERLALHEKASTT